MNYFSLDHWSMAFVAVVLFLFMVRAMLGGRRLW